MHRLYIVDASTRLGAMDKVTTPGDRYTSIRSHHFFRGVNWGAIETSSQLSHAPPPLPTIPTHGMNVDYGYDYGRASGMVDGLSLDFDFFS